MKLLEQADNLGITLFVQEDRLSYEVHGDSLEVAHLLGELREQKQAVLSYLKQSKRIEYHNGVRLVIGYTDADYRALLAGEYRALNMGICDVCHYHQAYSIWKDGKKYCLKCREQR